MSVHGLLGLPNQHTHGQEEEEARKEDGEEDEQVDVWLVLMEHQVAECAILLGAAMEHHEEAGDLEVVDGIGESDDEAVLDITSNEENVRIPDGDESHKLGGVEFVDAVGFAVSISICVVDSFIGFKRFLGEVGGGAALTWSGLGSERREVSLVRSSHTAHII